MPQAKCPIQDFVAPRICFWYTRPLTPPNENTITHSLAVIGRILVPSHLSSVSLVVPTGVDKIIEVLVTTSTTEGGGNATSRTYIRRAAIHTAKPHSYEMS